MTSAPIFLERNIPARCSQVGVGVHSFHYPHAETIWPGSDRNPNLGFLQAKVFAVLRVRSLPFCSRAVRCEARCICFSSRRPGQRRMGATAKSCSQPGNLAVELRSLRSRKRRIGLWNDTSERNATVNTCVGGRTQEDHLLSKPEAIVSPCSPNPRSSRHGSDWFPTTDSATVSDGSFQQSELLKFHRAMPWS